MSGISPTLSAQMQEIRTQNLAALLAAVDAASAPGTVESKKPQVTPGNSIPAKAPIIAPAIVVESPQSGRILIQIAGEAIELELPPALQRLAAKQPELFARGAQVPVQLSANGVRLASFPPPATPPQPAATIRQLSTSAPAVHNPVEAAPALANAFPPGSIGAAITRLTGLAFPIAERAATSPTPPLPSGEHAPLPRAALPALSALPAGLAEAILRTAAQQAPLAPSIAALLASPITKETAAPLAALQALRLNGLVKPDAPAIEQAVRRSGIFLESQIVKLAQPVSADESASKTAAQMQPDLKSVLLALKAAFEGKSLDRISPTLPEALPAASQRGQTQILPREGLLAARELAQTLHSPAPPSANADLVRLVEGAIERVKLSQLASLQDHLQVQVTDERSGGTRLALSLPLATQGMDRPQTATIGLVIEHHPPNTQGEFEIEEFSGGESEEAFPWKVRIAVDLEETGPVQAEIALRGQAIAITLWAERKAMAGMARAEIGHLHEALTKASFDVTRLEVRDGRPLGAAGHAVPVLDRRS